MNDHDRRNLEFLSSLDEHGWQDWTSQASLDDVMYAIELLQKFRGEFEVQALEWQDDVVDVSQAREILAKF